MLKKWTTEELQKLSKIELIALFLDTQTVLEYYEEESNKIQNLKGGIPGIDKLLKKIFGSESFTGFGEFNENVKKNKKEVKENE